MRTWLVYIILIFLPLSLLAQEPDTLPLRKVQPGGLPARTADSLQAAPSDTTVTAARMRIQQGMPSRLRDTTRVRGSRQWTLSEDYTTEISLPLDTAFSLFHRHRITDRLSDFNAYTGNYGLPVYPINFFDREWKPDRFIYSYYLPFMHTPANTRFMNTTVPFTEMVWTNGGARSKSEQTFRIRHSQNINRFMNFGLIYDVVYSIGQYNLQQAVDKNFLLHGSYNGNAYTAYFSAGTNNHESEASGGLISKDDLSQYSPEDMPFVLSDLNTAQNRLKNRYLMLVQRYSPGGKRDTVTGDMIRSGPVTFSYIGTYEWSKRRYLDSYPLSTLYDTVMISRSATEDSLFQGLLSNTIRADFAAGSTSRFRIGAGAGVRSELRNFVQVIPGDSLTRQDTVKRNMNSLVLTGKVFNNIGTKFGWNASGDLWFQGYRAGDFIVDGRVYKAFATSRKGMITWDATGSLASYTPSYWYYSWGSNNFSWQFDHSKEFRLTVGSSLIWPDRNMTLRFNYAIVDNYIYMDNAIPAQHEGGLSILALTARKDLSIWKLHLDNTILFQRSSNNEVLSLPLVTARTAFYFDHVFKFRVTAGELSFQLGAEAMLHTLYYAMNYMPATGSYFSQTETEVGNYPFINAFLNLKVKRTRLFIMADHLNSGMMGYEYFLVPGYPLNIRMIRYGLAWTFYD
jgi:Putative porin